MASRVAGNDCCKEEKESSRCPRLPISSGCPRRCSFAASFWTQRRYGRFRPEAFVRNRVMGQQGGLDTFAETPCPSNIWS